MISHARFVDRLECAALAAAFSAACSSSAPSARSCAEAADCGPAAHCVDHACVADAPPVASFTTPAQIGTNVIQRFASTSTDADGTIVAQRWSITAVDASCDADPASGAGDTLDTFFFCPGTYEVELVATDELGVDSAPQRVRVTAVQTAGAPSVSAGPDQVAGHTCSGSPLLCQASSDVYRTAIPLSSTAVDPDAGPITYQWIAVPPPVPAGAAQPSAQFVPGPGVASPTVWITSAGGPIAGAWKMKVRATDSQGLVAQAIETVVVENSPPAIGAMTLSLDHAYQSALYVASGSFQLPVADPDGDPLTGVAEIQETTPSVDCARAATVLPGGSVTFSIACADPAQLIGATARTLKCTISDPNGGEATGYLPIEIRNRPPVLALDPDNVALTLYSLDHTVGNCWAGQCFLASGANPLVAVDPDGDPLPPPALAPVPDATKPDARSRTWADETGAWHFELAAPLAYPAEFRNAQGWSGSAFDGAVADPFGASGGFRFWLQIGDRAPQLDPDHATASVVHVYDQLSKMYRATASLAPFVDPDGDPISVTTDGSDPMCGMSDGIANTVGVSCALAYDPPTWLNPPLPPLASFAITHVFGVSGSDPWATTLGQASVSIANQGPSASDFYGAATGCVCDINWYPGDPAIPVSWSDPDGDPALVIVTPGERKICVPGADCTVKGSSFGSGGGTFAVSVNDGIALASATATVTSVTCPKTGRCERVLP